MQLSGSLASFDSRGFCGGGRSRGRSIRHNSIGQLGGLSAESIAQSIECGSIVGILREGGDAFIQRR